MSSEPSLTFETSEELIKECITDLYIKPRKSIRKWSEITRQTAQGRFAYPAQHLASLITGIKGRGTAARGDDLADGTEVKSCSRADQLSECKKCKAKVLIWQKECPECGSKEIDYKTDSHWIFVIRSDAELDLLLNKIPRVILMLFDRKNHDSEDVYLRAWVLDPKNPIVRTFFEDYYHNNYKIKEKAAPCNLHPLLYDFYMMSPKLIFHAEMSAVKGEVNILFWDVNKPKEEIMPTSMLSHAKLIEIFGSEVAKLQKSKIVEKYPVVPASYLNKLELKKRMIKTYKKEYLRR